MTKSVFLPSLSINYFCIYNKIKFNLNTRINLAVSHCIGIKRRFEFSTAWCWKYSPMLLCIVWLSKRQYLIISVVIKGYILWHLCFLTSSFESFYWHKRIKVLLALWVQLTFLAAEHTKFMQVCFDKKTVCVINWRHLYCRDSALLIFFRI